MKNPPIATHKLIATATCLTGLLTVSLAISRPATANTPDDWGIEPAMVEATSGADTRSNDVEAPHPIWALAASNLYYTLPARGGSGGGPGTLSCGQGDVAVGIYGRSGIYIDQLGLTCAHLQQNGSLGPSYDTGTYGGPGGGFFRLSCPVDQAIVGFHGGSGTLVDRLGLYCSGVGNWRTNGSVQYITGSVGGGGGGPFVDLCPSDYVAARINVRTGLYVDQEELLCAYIYP